MKTLSMMTYWTLLLLKLLIALRSHVTSCFVVRKSFVTNGRARVNTCDFPWEGWMLQAQSGQKMIKSNGNNKRWQQSISARKTLSLESNQEKQERGWMAPLFMTTKMDGISSSSERNDLHPLSVPPRIGSVVTIECCLVPEGDFIPEPLFDGIRLHEESDEPPSILTFVLGKGNYLPGLHELILTTASTTTSDVLEASLDAGWGFHNPDLVSEISFDALGIDGKAVIKKGVELVFGNGLPCVVTSVAEDTFTIDANPPLAGASYRATIRLLNVEEGPPEFGFALSSTKEEDNVPREKVSASSCRYKVATFALGCFWGGELEYMREPGVIGTKVGYTQGTVVNPSYKQVCAGTTGHAEAIMVVYDPTVVSYDRLVHLAMDRLGENKYLLNQVGNDRGTQYRHGIYYHDETQQQIAESIIQSHEDCVTECLPASTFYDAEEYHQQYLLKGGQSARKKDRSVIRCYG